METLHVCQDVRPEKPRTQPRTWTWTQPWATWKNEPVEEIHQWLVNVNLIKLDQPVSFRFGVTVSYFISRAREV